MLLPDCTRMVSADLWTLTPYQRTIQVREYSSLSKRRPAISSIVCLILGPVHPLHESADGLRHRAEGFMLRIPDALLSGFHRLRADKVLGPLELSQTELGSEVVEIGFPSLIPVGAYGGEGRCPPVVESVDG